MDWRSWLRRGWGALGRAQGAWPGAPTGPGGPTSGPADDERGPAAPADDERSAARAVLDAAPSAAHRAVLEAALAAGHGPGTLARFADLLAATPAAHLADALDPLRRHPRQRSRTTCGSASLLVARALADPVFAAWLVDGLDARTGAASEAPPDERFAAAERAVKDRTNAVLGPVGPQPPWPPALGTPPWGAAHEMTRITGRRHRARLVGPDSPDARGAAYDAVERVVAAGGTAPVFLGDGATPRHVVLAVGRDGGALRLYDPASGDVVTLDRDRFVGGGFEIAGWTVPWAVVVPR